jgi:hypothetical protein
MKPTSIRYSRKFNLGNYESVELYAEAQLDEGERIVDNLPHLKKAIDRTFQLLHGPGSDVPDKLGKQNGLTVTQKLDKQLS